MDFQKENLERLGSIQCTTRKEERKEEEGGSQLYITEDTF